jgi:polar amino acid transport system substrate-binding protein
MPWAGINLAGRPTGAIVDLAEQLSQASGVAIQIAVVPYGRAAHMLIEGEADLMFAVSAGARNDLPSPIAELGKEEIVLLGGPGSMYVRLADLHRKTVGHLRKATFVSAFAEDADIAKYEFSSYEQGIQMLMRRRIDALIGSRITIDYTLRHLAIPAPSLSRPFLVSHSGIVLYVSKRAATPNLVANLKKACDFLRRKKSLEILLRAYLPGARW